MYDPATGTTLWEKNCASPVQWTVVDGDRLLVIDGRHECMLIEPQDGRERFRVALPLEAADDATFEAVTATSDVRRVYVVLNSPQDSTQLQFERGGTSDREVNGRLCAIERTTGQVAWTADLAGLHLDPLHPPEWPVLILTARQKRPDVEDFETVFHVLDKATGQTLLEDRTRTENVPRDFSKSMNWKVTPEGPMIYLATDRRSLEIRPAPAAEAAP